MNLEYSNGFHATRPIRSTAQAARWVLAAALGAPFLILSSCAGTPESPPQEEPTPVRVLRVKQQELPVSVAASGSVEAWDQAGVAFLVAGRVSAVHVDEGDRVRKGQLLAEVDSTDYEFALAAASGQVAVAAAQYEKALAGTRTQDLEQARVAYEQAADEYRRMKQLFERKSLAPNDFKKIEAKYLAAREQYAKAKEGARAEDIAAAKAAVKSAQAQESVARKRLADTKLTSPIDGVVARRLIDPGEVAATGHPVLMIVKLNPVKVRVGVPEAEIGRVKVGQSTTVMIPALPQEVFEGKVESVGVAAEPTSRTYTVKVAVPNPRQLLRAGMIAEARIHTDASVQAITLPGDTVVRDPQGATLVYVYSPESGRANARRVEVGTVFEQEVEIVSGLRSDEVVVSGGQHELHEGDRVQPVEVPE